MSARACFTAVALCFTAWSGVARASVPDGAPPAEYAVDADGRSYRVVFDPGDGLTLAVGTAAGQGDTVAPGVALAGQIGVRTVDDDDGESARWDSAHTILPWALRPHVSGPNEWDAGLYRVLARRHSRSPSLVLPTLPPTKLAFPFDLALSLDLAEMQVRSLADDAGRVGDVTVIDGAFLLDPLRNGPYGAFLGFGVGARYDVRVRDVDGDSHAEHALAPFTAGVVHLHLEDTRGLTLLDARGAVVPAWRTDGTFRLGVEARGRFERTLLAVNDTPVVVALAGDYRYRPDPLLPNHEGRATASVGVRFFP